MADDVFDPTQQASIDLPNGVVMTGAGEQDTDALRDQFEDRHEERTGQPISEPAPVDAQPKRQLRGQKRFDQLTHEREQEKSRADAAEARARDLEAKLNAPKSTPVTTPPVTTATAPQTRPKPEESEIGTKYSTLSAYFEDLADWKAEQREASLLHNLDARLTASIEADRASRTRIEQAQQMMAAGRAAYSDFDAVLATATKPDLVVPPMQQDAIMKMANREHVLYALGKDHAALKALIAESDPVMMGVRLASLVPAAEAVASPASTPVAVRTTNAPAPPQPVGAGTRTAQPSLAELASSGNFDAYKARRAAELKAAG